MIVPAIATLAMLSKWRCKIDLRVFFPVGSKPVRCGLWSIRQLYWLRNSENEPKTRIASPLSGCDQRCV